MKMRLVAGLPLVALLCTASNATASADASASYTVRAVVPVICTLSHPAAAPTPLDHGYALGDLKEYCNAPSGYAVTVNYAPGSLRGAVIAVGDERVMLDGSGSTTISRAPGPRIRDRTLVAIPGPSGFDTDRLNFQITAV
ncbi:MAG: hypothetical protein ACTHKR_03175 [Sphingomonas sp.]